MCGLFGYVGLRDEAPQLVLAGLKKLEYRGYDSWGIAARQNGTVRGQLLIDKRVGKIGEATTNLPAGHAALGHTRWATHGGVTETNAHPHLDCRGRLAVVHNGIVENHAELRELLVRRGHQFASQTDTEVVSHLLEEELGHRAGRSELVDAMARVFRQLEGLSAISVLDREEHCIIVAKNGSPVVLGLGRDGNYIASDSSALLEHTRRLMFLENGQAALVTADSISVYDAKTGRVQANARVWDIPWTEERTNLGAFPDYMAKEMREQPEVLRRLAGERVDVACSLAHTIRASRNVHLVGCGSAAHAARWGEYLLMRAANRPAHASVGSEFAYLAEFVGPDDLVIALSQSGETIDLLESLNIARKHGAGVTAMVNVEGSSIYRLVDEPMLLSAGPERCVLATKSFTAKLGLLLLTAYAAAGKPGLGRDLLNRAAHEIERFFVDGRLEQVRRLAHRIEDHEHLYVIGRGPSYPLALEAALKIKEVSYIHAEGFAGGEMKHGAIALIEQGTPCIVIAPADETFRSIMSGAQEIKARGGYIIGISPTGADVWDEHIPVEDLGDATSIVNALPPQLLAYELATGRGLDPDKPRNLAKSVTVK